MPITVELQTPDGVVIETLEDLEDVLHRTLPYYDDATFRLLNKVDWYGDTDFDAEQMPILLDELDRLMPRAAIVEEANFLKSLKHMFLRCGATPGCKLKFVGD